MGQCSTLPADSRATSSPTSGRETEDGDPMREQTHRLNESGRRESLDFNVLVAEQPTKLTRKMQKMSPRTPATSATAQSREPEHMRMESQPTPMDIDNRESPAPYVPPTPLPENAIKTRCYRLNLDSETVPGRQHLSSMGPFTEPPPYLTYSSSEDSSQELSATAVAIQTAQIFRGITVGRDGTILSQNARATRSSRGNKTKRGEKSRQAAKIDKAKDLVEEAALAGKSKKDDADNMVSLFIVGEYDDMKQLVRDGSKKLREAEGLPDEALLSINRARASTRSSRSGQRRRSSESYHSAQKQAFSPVLPQSAPPKLKSNPRDTRSSRKDERTMRMRLESCHDFVDPRKQVADEGDWSHAWNIWNCGGGTGTVSPLQPSSPKKGGLFEGRDAAYGTAREAGVTSRAN